MMQLRAATYLRSSKDRAELGIDAQRAELSEFANRNGLTIVCEFSDMELSGSGDETTRPGLRELLAELRNTKRDWSSLLVLDTSRIARDPMLGIYIQREAEKAGVTIQFSKMAIDGSSAFGEMMLNVARSFDRLHARLSGEKGKAGQVANIAKGFRSGGRAPLGYKLEKIDTGALRGGKPVTKSKLVPDLPLAPQVAQFLVYRAEGLGRAEAIRRSGLLDRNPATMIGVESNALVYAGLTVWNRRQKQRPSRDQPYQRMLQRDASEWVISPAPTHEALITREQAEAVLAANSIKQKQNHRVRKPEEFLLTGLIFAPDGTQFWGDSRAKAYRAGKKGKRVSQAMIEEAVINRLHSDSQSTTFKRNLVRAAKKQAAKINVDIQTLDADLSAHRIQLSNLIEIAANGSKGVAARINELELAVAHIEEQKADASRLTALKASLFDLNEADITQWMMSMDIFVWRAHQPSEADSKDPLLECADFEMRDNSDARMRLRRWITSLLERIEYDPESRAVSLHYRWGSGVKLASPRGFEPRYLP